MRRGKTGVPMKKIAARNHGGNDGDRVGFEKVGSHPSAVADVIADVISDGRGIARIVFGNTGSTLPTRSAADIGALGEDTAAETGEDRNQRGAEAESHQRIDNVNASSVS